MWSLIIGFLNVAESFPKFLVLYHVSALRQVQVTGDNLSPYLRCPGPDFRVFHPGMKHGNMVTGNMDVTS